ncbi:hypothetical protein D9M68_367420 [compost metagenome]
MIHEKKISNHPLFEDVERWVQITANYNDSRLKTFDLYYRMRYERDGADISNQFNQDFPVWRTDNSRMMFQRDLETFERMLNPDFVEVVDELGNIMNEEERHLMQPAYDYTVYLMMQLPIPNSIIMDMYIAEEDADGRFNS